LAVTDSILVTGFPGLRARAVTAAVLAGDRDARITLLVHPNRRADTEAALSAFLARERVTVLEGDAAAIDLGLAGAAFRELAETVRVVHHAYQVVDLDAPAEVARAVNVGGAREMIELGRAAKHLERLVVHSSVFVSGARTGSVLESELAAGQTFRSPVEESLALAEQMLSRHAALPLSIVRAPWVVGDSLTGEVDRLGGIYPLLVFLASAPRATALPLPPRSDGTLYAVPVDYVARAARIIAGHPGALKKTVHLVDTAAPTVQRFVEIVAERLGQAIESSRNPAAFGRALVRNPGVGLLARKFRLVSDLVGTDAQYDNRNAVELLSPSRVECPPLESYVDVMLEHVERRVAERRVAAPASTEASHVAN
ncbi:MAG TPA: SDR family oxidoreductase, partial [Polyangiaceae bacterium]